MVGRFTATNVGNKPISLHHPVSVLRENRKEARRSGPLFAYSLELDATA
jgi:hypothetical protein